jgi:hypothetical protein
VGYRALVKLSTGSWDEPRQAALIAQIMNAELSLPAACERHELSPETVRKWVPVFRLRTLQALDDKLQQTSLIHSVNADGFANAIYSGSIEDIPLSDLMQTCQMGGKDAVITVTSGNEQSSIWCEKGVVVDAESGKLRGEAAVYRILELEHGQVAVDFRHEPRERTIEATYFALLLESARHKDESRRLLEQLDGTLAIYSPAPGAQGADTTLTDREVLDLCDGDRSIADVLAASERSDLDTLTTFASLVERGYLVRHGISTPPPAPESRSGLEGWASGKTLQLSFEDLGVARNARPRARWRLAMFAAATLVLGMLGWRSVEARRPDAASAASTAASSLTYRVEVSTEPATAEVWLDGARAGAGRLQRDLLRDGKLRQLEVFAPGHAPTTLIFTDRSAHFHVVLSPLSDAVPRSVVSAAAVAGAARDSSPPQVR